MKKISKYTCCLLCFLFLNYQAVTAQEGITTKNDPFDYFKDYKRIGFYLSIRNYQKGEITKETGTVNYNSGKFWDFSLGADYVIRPAHKWSFRSGLHINSFPISKGEFLIPENHLAWDGGNLILGDDYIEVFLSIPFETEHKKQIGKNIVLSLRGGIDLLIPFHSKSFYETIASYESTKDPEYDNIQIYIARATKIFPIYPNLKLAPGVYFVFDTFMLQTALVYQKNIPTFYKGEYKLGNFEVPQETKGTYTMTGDYIGIEFLLFLKKTRPRK